MYAAFTSAIKGPCASFHFFVVSDLQLYNITFVLVCVAFRHLPDCNSNESLNITKEHVLCKKLRRVCNRTDVMRAVILSSNCCEAGAMLAWISPILCSEFCYYRHLLLSSYTKNNVAVLFPELPFLISQILEKHKNSRIVFRILLSLSSVCSIVKF